MSDAMKAAYQTNTKVEWNWGDGTAEGYVRKVFREETIQIIKGTQVDVELYTSHTAGYRPS